MFIYLINNNVINSNNILDILYAERWKMVVEYIKRDRKRRKDQFREWDKKVWAHLKFLFYQYIQTI